MNAAQVRQIRLSHIAMIPQGAMNSLNPVVRIRDQMILTMREHGADGTAAEMLGRVAELLEKVGLQADVGNRYPHELSGGMKQRVCIAQAISLGPKLILADEPTGNLDPDLSLDIMNLFRRLNEVGVTMLIATHDLTLLEQLDGRKIELANGEIIGRGNST